MSLLGQQAAIGCVDDCRSGRSRNILRKKFLIRYSLDEQSSDTYDASLKIMLINNQGI